MEKKILITQPTFLPYGGFFAALIHANEFIILDDVQFEKRSWQQRNIIFNDKTKKEILLTIPVLSKNNFNQKINEVKINDPFLKIRKKILKSIFFCYKNSKYFNNYFGQIEKIFLKNHNKLIDLNIELINLILEILEIDVKKKYASDLNIDKKKSDLIYEICFIQKATTLISSEGSKNYLGDYKKKKINTIYFHYIKDQNNNDSHYSILNYIFNFGKESKDIIKNKLHLENDNV